VSSNVIMIKVGIITISDKGSRGEREDLSGEEIKKIIHLYLFTFSNKVINAQWQDK